MGFLRRWWPTLLAVALLVGVLGGRWVATRPRTVTMGTTSTSSGLVVTVSTWERIAPFDLVGWPGGKVPPGAAPSAARVESCRSDPAGQLADLSRFGLELASGDVVEPAGSRMGTPEDDCVRGSIAFALPGGETATAVVFDGSPKIRWTIPR